MKILISFICLICLIYIVMCGCVGDTPIVGIDDRTGTGVSFGQNRTELFMPGNYMDLNINQSITVEAWIFLDTRLSRNGIINMYDVDDNRLYGFSLAVNVNRLQFKLGTTNMNSATDSSIFASVHTLDIPRLVNGVPTNASWHHIAGIYDFNNGEVFTCLDGSCAMIRTQTGEIEYLVDPPYVPELTIGGTFSRAVIDFIDVTLDRVAIWNTARTQAQIQESARRYFVQDVDAVGLVGYWEFGKICDPRNLVESPVNQVPSSANGTDAIAWPTSTLMSAQQSIGGHKTTWWQNNFCGDSIVCGAEECDDSSTGTSGSCLCTCKLAKCGDGFLHLGVEECDDGLSNSNFSFCSSSCKNTTCGDGVVQSLTGEQCDLGAANNLVTAACLPNCLNATCGDGNIFVGVEECDEGANNSNGGNCTLSCKNATCGDGNIFIGVEDCDDGNNDDTDGCFSNCTCNDPTPFNINRWVMVNQTVTVTFFAPCVPVNCEIARVPQTIPPSLEQLLMCNITTDNIVNQTVTFTPNSPGRYVINITNPNNNNMTFGTIMIAVIDGNGIYTEGRCTGRDCCNMVQACIVDLKTNNVQLNATIAADWIEEDMLCPFPVCSDGYMYEQRTLTPQCVRYNSTGSITHDPYTSLRDCLFDFRRYGNHGHCRVPLEKAWRYCKKGVGLY